MNVPELRAFLPPGTGKNLIYRALADGTLPSVRLGHKILIPKTGLLRWLETAGLNAADAGQTGPVLLRKRNRRAAADGG